jgi:uncharacterized protein (DUF2141 family)
LKFLPTADYKQDLKRFQECGVSKIDESSVLVSDGLLYVRMPQNLDQEPTNRTDIQNLFIAGEFTRTNFSIPTMEKSCESGMRCASEMCEANGYEFDYDRLLGAELPFGFLRAWWFRWVVRFVGVILAAGILWHCLAGSAHAAESGPAEIRVEILNLKDDQGDARCLIFNSEAGFPSEEDRAVAKDSTKITNRTAGCRFHDLPVGSYAVSVLHDANGNRRLDTDWLGRPKEGFGVSNNARGKRGPPPFSASRFDYAGGTTTLRIGIVYP